jgi:hypothetical protein
LPSAERRVRRGSAHVHHGHGTLFPFEEAGAPGEQALGVKEWPFSIDC